MTSSLLKFGAACGMLTLLTLSATPASAVMPVFMKYDGVEGEAAPVRKPSAAPVSPMNKPKLTTRKSKGEAASSARKVKPVKPDPQAGLLLPAVQKARSK